MEIWIEISFDGQPMDNITANNIEEANELINLIEMSGFEEYNEEVKSEWLEMGFRNNPVVTARITQQYN